MYFLKIFEILMSTREETDTNFTIVGSQILVLRKFKTGFVAWISLDSP